MCIRDRFNIYPVASEKFDNIVGVVYLKDLFGRIDQPDFSINQDVYKRQLYESVW